MKDLIVYQIPEMSGIQVKSNIVYSSPGLTLDVCRPENFDGITAFPAVILISGGVNDTLRFSPKLKEIYLSWGKLLAAHDVIAVHFVWRYKHPYDCERVFEYIGAHAQDLCIDKNRIGTFSFSRGVGLSFAGLIKTDAVFIKCMVCYYGRIPVCAAAMSGKTPPPLLLVMAGNDRFFPADCNNEFIEKARSLNWSVEFLMHETGEHAFDIRNNDKRSKELIKRTIHFIRQNI